jgi:endoglucanase
LIIADGLAWGRKLLPELVPLGLAQSARGFDSMQISHYRASWIDGSNDWPLPQSPMPPADSGQPGYDRQQLWEQIVAPWVDLANQGVGVHLGE